MDTCSYFWVGKERASSQASHELYRKVVCFTPWKALFEEKKVGTFHSTKKSCLNFRSIYSNEWNGIFHNFQKTGQPREVSPNFRKIFSRSFLSIQLSSRGNLYNFQLNGSHFGNSTASWISGNFFPENFCTTCSCFQISKSLVEYGKRPLFCSLGVTWPWSNQWEQALLKKKIPVVIQKLFTIDKKFPGNPVGK